MEAVQQAVDRSDLQLSHKKLLKRKEKFDFSARLRLGRVLFVGEGNFSFSLSLAKQKAVSVSSILATAYEAEDDLTDAAYQNAGKLIGLGVQVKTGVDATRLSETIGSRRFATIIFQFPNVASRDPKYVQNPNHVLVSRFLKSSRPHLKRGGVVVISTVDSPFYEGALKMNEAARKAGFAEPDIYDYQPSDFAGYTHQNTADEDSAIDDHGSFATFAFSG
ncbi:MAG: DUF2431 domain-containing protein [Sediminimonas sp.]|uniref:Rossmann-like fold-containing protein n=1 Tax=Sediminimonas sp. TaxID=2823379 RepID=UPI002870A8EF|nr:Rossmann-like fold-containing protein [Sediminimonas sp.]MDR9486209.1 DUF2431 domain-containing protein [Sediminimonas sp.]